MKALVLLSGGVDSAVCLASAVEKYGAGEVLALSVVYGQRHSRELEAARALAAHYGVTQRVLELGELFRGSACTLLAESAEAVPHGDYADQLAGQAGAPVSTYVPFRNGLFLSAAASVALSNGCETLYYGAHADDAAGSAYPDTSPAFNRAISAAITLGSGGALRVEAPFIQSRKADIVATGHRLGVPFALTWSCYEGGERACGLCGTCRDRLRAFAANGLEDPIPYVTKEVLRRVE